jgi:hypothetical protein
MKRLLSILILAALLPFLTGAVIIISGPVVAGGGGSAPTYLVKQGFEGTGYDNSETWYPDGAVNPDFSTSGFGMVGSQCLELEASSASAESGVFQWWTATSPIGSSFLFRFTALPTTLTQVAQIRNGFDVLARLQLLYDGTFYVQATGGSAVQTVGTLSVNTTYRIWLEYTKGTGSDALAKVYFSTDNTKPASGNNVAQSTNGTVTENADSFYLLATKDGTGQKHYFDEVRVDDVAIGSDPI